jgi:hypothetical protein
VEEMPMPVGDFRRPTALARTLLRAALKYSELFLLLPEEFWRCDP